MKHAFLIMAHGNWELLATLIEKLDHPDNDIFLHIDKKVSFPEETKKALEESAHYSKLTFAKRIRINWGGYSQIECELRLIECAKNSASYDYYHIMSGVDFPIKPMTYIHKYFEDNKGCEFCDFEPDEWTERTAWQFRYYHLLQEYVARKNSRKYPSYFIEYYLLKIQEKLNIDRRKKQPEIVFRRAPNWVSITDAFAGFLLSKEKWIRQTFKWTKCSDEMIVATVMFNSDFEKKRKPCMRYIDWTRGTPYTFTIDEYDEIMKDEALFVRKVGVDTEKRKALVEKLCEL